MKSNIKFYKNKLSLFLSALFLIQLVLFNTNNIVFAATTPSVSYTVTGETKIGNTIEIAVNVSNISDLYAGSIDFVYDTNLLEIQSITKGNIFGNNEVLTPIGANGKIENGQASFAITMKGNKDGISSDNGTIAVIKAKILKEGTVKLNTTSSNTESLNLTGNTIRVKLADSNGSNISYNFTNKNIALENNISLDLTADKDTCNLGESITFTANSNLGNNAQYGFYVYIDGAWKLVKKYSSDNTLTYTAPKSGTFKVRALVRDKNNYSNKTYKDLSFTVSNNASLSSLTANKTSSSLGETLTFTATSNLGTSSQYRFYIYIDNTWKLVQTYSSKNTLTYTPPKAGTYKVRAWVRDANNTSNATYKDLSFTVTNNASLSSLTANKTSSSLGETLTFTANSNLGNNAQYGFYVYIDGAWKLVKKYSSDNTLTYTAPKSGTFKVRALVRDKNNYSNKTYKDLSFTVSNKASLTSLTADKSTISLGESVTFTASSNLGNNAQYGFYVYIDGAWKLVKKYSSDNTLTYTAPKSGTFKVRALVRDKNNYSNKTYKDLSFTVSNKASLTSLTADKSTISLGESVTFTASSNLGSNAQYGFYVYIDGAWKLVKKYSSDNTLTYTAPKAGTYKVRAWVRDANNTSNATYKDLSFTVTNNASLSSLTANKTSSSLGETLTFTATSNLGTSSQYRFYIYIDNTWKLVQTYSSKNTLTYTPPKAGTYKVRAWVRDANNTSNATYKDLSFTVTNNASLSSLTANKTSSSLGETLTFTATSNLGTSSQYRFYIYIDNAWKLVQTYSSKNTLTYTPPKAGTYKVRAWVRDANNTSNATYKDLSFTVK